GWVGARRSRLHSGNGEESFFHPCVRREKERGNESAESARSARSQDTGDQFDGVNKLECGAHHQSRRSSQAHRKATRAGTCGFGNGSGLTRVAGIEQSKLDWTVPVTHKPAYSFTAPSSLPRFRSKVPSGRCPAFRASSSSRQSE